MPPGPAPTTTTRNGALIRWSPPCLPGNLPGRSVAVQRHPPLRRIQSRCPCRTTVRAALRSQTCGTQSPPAAAPRPRSCRQPPARLPHLRQSINSRFPAAVVSRPRLPSVANQGCIPRLRIRKRGLRSGRRHKATLGMENHSRLANGVGPIVSHNVYFPAVRPLQRSFSNGQAG